MSKLVFESHRYSETHRKTRTDGRALKGAGLESEFLSIDFAIGT